MKHPDNMYLVARPLNVDDSIVTPEEDASVSARRRLVGMTAVGKLGEDLSASVDGLDDAERSGRFVGGNVVMDLPKPTLGLVRPDYLRQDSMRRPISSFEMMRPASESAMPCSAIAAKASSRRISSTELSSGCSSISRISCSLAGLMRVFYPRGSATPPPRLPHCPPNTRFSGEAPSLAPASSAASGCSAARSVIGPPAGLASPIVRRR